MNLSLKLKRKLFIVIRFAIAGSIAGLVFRLITDKVFHHAFVTPFYSGAFVGLSIGLFLSIYEVFIFPNRWKQKSFSFILLNKALIYSFTIILSLVFIEVSIFTYESHQTFKVAAKVYFNTRFTLDFLFSFSASIFLTSLLLVSSLFNTHTFIRFLSGRYHKPIEEERIFMFVDLKSSTTIAEKIGHLQYSSFLKDFYFDITEALLITGAEVYQYVGDEVVLTWQTRKGLKNNHCISCFYEMKKEIEIHKNKYIKKYGFYPVFKAGLHEGKVIATWVGEVKRELVFHGDVLNTAARIQSVCNEYKQELIASGDIINQLKKPFAFTTTYLNTLALRGKQEEVELYGITPG